MKVALLTDGIYPYVVGGMQKHSFNLAKYFALNKVEVDLYHTCPKENLAKAETLEVFTHEEKKYIRSFLLPYPGVNYFPGHYIKESFLYSEAICKELLKNEPVDFIYAQGFTAWKLIKEKQGGRKLPPVAVNFHGLEMFQYTVSLKAKLQQLLLKGPAKYNVLNADYVINYGGKISELLLSLGCKQEQLITSPNGVEPRWLETSPSPGGKPRRFLFIGRFERRKGVQELMKALAELYTAGNDFEFHFVGPIPEAFKMINNKVVYHGTVVEFEAVRKIMRSADILVCPSLAEGMPTVVVEAMAAGLAVITTDTGACREMVAQDSGWLLNPGSVKELVGAMQEALQMNEEELNRKKINAIAVAREKFSWDKIIADTLSSIVERS